MLVGLPMNLHGLRPAEALRIILCSPMDEGGLGMDEGLLDLSEVEEFDRAVDVELDPDPIKVLERVLDGIRGRMIFVPDSGQFEFRVGDPRDDEVLIALSCRECGCTELAACSTPDGPCSWAEPGLCSACSSTTKEKP